MNTAAQQMARLALAALSPVERAALLAEVSPAQQERILTRADVARRFNRTTRWVDLCASRGLLQKVKLPGATRAVGFRQTDVERLLKSTDLPPRS